jgi:hypothetical protein
VIIAVMLVAMQQQQLLLMTMTAITARIHLFAPTAHVDR